MDTHPFFPQYLRLAWGCITCDGDVAEAEVSCLRSIAVQMGQPLEEVKGTIDNIRTEFATDPRGMIEDAKRRLMGEGLDFDESVLLMDMLVQLVEADSEIQASESEYVRQVVDDLGLDRGALSAEYPEWRTYLVEGYRVRERVSADFWQDFVDAGGGADAIVAPRESRNDKKGE